MRIFQEWFGGKIKFLLLLVFAFAAGVCGVHVVMDVWQDWHTPPEERVGEALLYAVEAPMYRYTSEAVRITNGQEQVITVLEGEKNGENIHLYGRAEVVDTDIDVYQIGDDFYRKDIVSGQWMKMTGQNLEATEYLMQEINPLGCMMFSSNAQVVEQGKEKLNGVKCRKYQVQSSGERTFLTSAWSEFYYIAWIDKKNRLQQVEIIADDHDSDAEQLHLLVRFDWEAEVAEITVPM